MRRTLAVIALLALAPAAPAVAQQLEVSLDDAVRRALAVQPAMVEARGDAADADAGMRAAYGAFLPTVALSSSAFRLNNASIVNGFQAPAGTYTFNSGVALSVDLFAGFRRLARRGAAAATQDAAEAGLVNQRYQVTLQVKQTFYDALASEELVRVAQAQVRRAEQQRQIAVDKLRAGSATRSDTLRSAVDLGNARLALLEARADLATAQANLGRAIGTDAAVRAAADTGLPAPPDTAALRAAALVDAPLLRQAVADERAAGAGAREARAPYWPTLALSYSASSQGLTEPWTGFGGGNRNQNRLQFSLSWTLFDGFEREQRVTQAAWQQRLAAARAADARRRVNAELTQQLAALYTAREQLEISGANVAAATEDLRVLQERYRVGAATILDLLTSQASLTQAEVSLVQARFNYLIARAQLEALVGRAL